MPVRRRACRRGSQCTSLGYPEKYRSPALSKFKQRFGNRLFRRRNPEEVLTRLTKIEDLKVISRSSTQGYQSEAGNLAEIGKQLGVANILQGSIQKAADQVRVNVHLVNVETGSHLWAETYDRN
jgi:TolB-like protein